MNATLKRLAERTLVGVGVPGVARAWRRGGAVVLAYHNVVPAGEPVHGDRSLHLPQADFARQLDALRETHDVVPLDALFDPEPQGTRPRAVITFDDAYRGAMTAGLAELARRGMPATVFVAPGLLGTAPWWDELSGPGGLDDALRAHALDIFAGKAAEVRAWAAERGIAPRPLPHHQHIVTEDELARGAAQPGIALGSHTWSHVNLAVLDVAERETELARPMAWLAERLSSSIRWIAYPYGLSSPDVETDAARLGYEGAFRVSGGWMPRDGSAPRHALPRLNVPAGVSIDGFRLRLAGLRAEG